MTARVFFFLAVALLPTLASAQVRPQPGPGDPRIQSVLYNADQVVQLQVATGYQLTVEFAPGERIENVAVGDSGAWQVTPNKRGDHLFIKATQNGVSTNLTVVTDSRTYAFELAPLYGSLPDMAYTVRFRYPPPAAAVAATADTTVEPGRYRLTGDKAIRPDAIDDDGVHTYIVWSPDQALPAIFAIGRDGKEMLVNGAMRDDSFVIDSVSAELVFRLGDLKAGAVRVQPGRKR